MAHLIDKSALVAEIKERIETYNKGYANGDDKRADALEVLLHDIETLEVKEVDLGKEYEKYYEQERYIQTFKLAKHFFELGLRVNGYHQAEKDNELTWEDMRELYIIFADVDVGIELCKTDIQAETIGYYQEVLKRFKAYKGEEV